jgi:ATP-dependent RNA/DNA helicase IGHMBP2
MGKKPPTAADRLRAMKALLEIERDEDLRLYREQFLRVNLDKRKKNGVTWHPLKIVNEEIGTGELLHLEVERTSHLDKPHQFTAGKNVGIFTASDETIAEVTGTIKTVSRNSMKIVMHAEELPDWCYEGKLGLNIQFDDNTYNEMQKALDRVAEAEHNRTAELREIIEGVIDPAFDKKDDRVSVQRLNKSQNDALRHVLSVRDVGVIHGPPGTGKTTTLVQAIRLTVQTEKQVLVCAPTNSAVDLLAEKLDKEGVNVIRLGHPARISDDLIRTSLDGKVSASPYFAEIKMLRKKAEEYFSMAGKFKRVLGRGDVKQRGEYYAEARNCLKEARQLEDYIVDDLLRAAEVICCTPVTSTFKALARKRFNTLFFDEASQALEPMIWIPLLRCRRLILSGDHFQLPPVVKSITARKGGLDETILDRCIELKGTVAMLTRQYRMNNVIMGFSNQYFYGGKLEADESVASHALANDSEHYLDSSIEFIDTAGCGFDEQQNPETLSYANPREGEILYKHLSQLLAHYSAHDKLAAIHIGIISPYKEQREWLSSNRESFEPDDRKVASLSIKTIDGFQGEERDVIYISLVRSNETQEIGFLNDLRRMNVAITRARKKLVVIGDSATIGATPFYKAFLEYCERHGIYRTAWEWIGEA